MIKETLRMRGHLRIDKFDEHGKFTDFIEDENIFLTLGINEMWKLITGQSANTFTTAQAQIGIGDSATAAVASQTDLQAAANKAYVLMDAGYPTVPSAGAIQFRATFGSAVANYVWSEFVLKHLTSLISLDRATGAWGTKAAGTTWVATLTATIA